MSSGAGEQNQRRHGRAAVELPVTVTESSNRVQGGIRFDVANLSSSGAFLRSDLLFEIGEVLKLEFTLPDGRRVQTGGRVVWIARENSEDKTTGMGVTFLDLADADKKALEVLLSGDDV